MIQTMGRRDQDEQEKLLAENPRVPHWNNRVEGGRRAEIVKLIQDKSSQ